MTDSRAAALHWVGADAEVFRGAFQQALARWEELNNVLGSIAEHLAHQAAQQDSTSSVDGRIDPSDYGELLGGGFLDWSDVINGGERIGDLWRDPVQAGDPDSPLGQRVTDKYPEWDPSSVGTDKEAIVNQKVHQGSLGDCWFLASLMSAQQTNPDLLAENLTAKGDPPGSEGWNVRLFVDGQWRDIPVSPDDLGVNGSKTVAGADDPTQVGWASVYEQAMINAVDGRPSEVWADTPAAGLEMVTGQPSQESSLGGQPSFDQYKAAIDEGRPVTVMTNPITPIGSRGDELAAAHVYQVSGYDESTGEIILTNPWGPDSSSKPYEVRIDPENPTYANDIVMTGIGEKPDAH